MRAWLVIGVLVVAGAAAAFFGVNLFTYPTKSLPSVKPPVLDMLALQKQAQAGDAKSQAELGRLYAKGEGVTNSYAEAAKWFRLAADQTNSDALLGLGELYEAGQGVPKDLDQAVKLYRQAAEVGNADGEYTLAFMYESGRGVRQSHAEAAKWFQRAAEQGQVLAQYDLGQRYNLGVGVVADRVEALKWLMLAADKGQGDAAQRRDQLKRELTSEQVSEARRRAAKFSAGKPGSQ
jgi:TPR repeat protein